MGLIEKIKHFFTEEKSDVANLSLENLSPEIINKELETIEKNLSTHYKIINNDLKDILERLNSNAKNLEKIDLNQKRVESRIRDANQTARKEFLFYLNKLIESLKEEKSGEELLKFISSELNKFHQQTKRSHQLASLIIGEEMKIIKDDIKKIERLEFDFIDKNKFILNKKNSYKKIMSLIEEKAAHSNKISSYDEDSTRLNENISNNKNSIENLNQSIKKIRDTREYQDYIENEIKLHEINDELISQKTVVNTMFNKKLLEKFLQTQSDKEIISLTNEYILDSSKALIKDVNLKIIDIYDLINEQIQNGTLQIKESEKNSSKLKINRQLVLDYYSKLKKLEDDKNKLTHDISINNFNFEKDLDQISQLQNNISKAESELTLINKKKEKIHPEIFQIDEKIKSELEKI